MHYNITILRTVAGQPTRAFKSIESWHKSTKSRGTLLACWHADIGNINQILLMHSYDGLEQLHADRQDWLMGGHQFGASEDVTGISMRCGQQMTGVPEIKPGKLGPIYEVRTYVMQPHDFAKGKQAWADAIPGRSAVTRPLILMWTTDGPATGLIHIWPYASVEERMQTRRKVIEMGVWPPKDGARYIASQQSDIFLPAPFSPLC